MTRPYSLDLRERVYRDVSKGDSIRAVAARFDVSPSFVSKLGKRQRETGSLRPDPQGGDRWSHWIEAYAAWIEARLEEAPDVTLLELRDGLAERGLATSINAVHNFMKRRDPTFKKRPLMRPNRSAPTSP